MTDKPIFINYRRTKSRDKALILRWILEKEFGEGVSFLDEASIVPGQFWNEELKRTIADRTGFAPIDPATKNE